jgi:hypothetical protein
MNFIAIIILCTIGVDFILNLAADRLNLKHLRSKLPPAFEGITRSGIENPSNT